MGLTELWTSYRSGDDHSRLAEVAKSAEEEFYTGLVALAEGDHEAASGHVARARDLEPGRIVFDECARYLESLRSAGRAGTAEIYLDAEAFSAFGRGGGNVPLYERTHALLRERYEELKPEALLDIGTGEGLGLLPALSPAVGRVDVVEPSTTRIDVVRAALAERGLPHRAFATTMADFIAAVDGTDDRWDLVQETFAMLSLPADERAGTFRWLRERTSRLVLVEFDVPRAEHPLHPDWYRYVLSRYEAGMAEYPEPYNLVRQGFLAPVLLGTLRPSEDKVHYEQTVDDWCRDLAEAGFALDGEPRHVSDFWWGEAFLIEAK